MNLIISMSEQEMRNTLWSSLGQATLDTEGRGSHTELTEYVVFRRHPRATEWSEKTLETAASKATHL